MSVCNLFSLGAVAALVAVGLYAAACSSFAHEMAKLSNGYGAKVACSVVFVSGRTLQSAIDAELTFPPIRLVSTLKVDPESKCVIADSRIGHTRKACWKSNRLGCSLETPGYAYPVPSAEDFTYTRSKQENPFPIGDRIDEGKVASVQERVDMKTLNATIEEHFNNSWLHARAVLVIKDGTIIYEKYGDGTTMDTRLLGWSMTKSWLHTLVGIAINEGILPDGLDTKVKLPFWNDERAEITLDDMLRMTDGLDFDEFYTPGADAPNMIFVEPTVSMNGLEYLTFPTESFFKPMGMDSAVLETDSAGVFIGSSFGWATARDWGRFGMLYLDDGIWNGKRLLPEGWVNFTSTPTETSNGWYGAQFWLGPKENPPKEDPKRVNLCDNIFPSRKNPDRSWLHKAFPEGAFAACGFEEQSVIIFPKANSVVVRLGQTKEVIVNNGFFWDKTKFYSLVLNALL